jgi:hypothetical protein
MPPRGYGDGSRKLRLFRCFHNFEQGQGDHWRRLNGAHQGVGRRMTCRNGSARPRDHTRQQKRQKFRIGLRRPIDLRARPIAKTRPIDTDRRIPPRKTLLQRTHLMSRRDRTQRREKKDLRIGPGRISAEANRVAAPVPLQRPCFHDLQGLRKARRELQSPIGPF